MDTYFEEQKQRAFRIRLFYGIFGGMFLFLFVGLGFRQLYKNEDYLAQEERQSLRRVIQPAPRGEIFDREGRLLVGNRPMFSAAVYLNELRNEFRDEYYKRVRSMRAAGVRVSSNKLRNDARIHVLQKYLEPINKLLGRRERIDMKDLERHFQQRLLLPMVVARDLSIEEYAKLTEQLPVESPIQVLVDNARYYPYGSLGAHVLGYVSNTPEASGEGVPGEHLKTFSFKGKLGKKGLEHSFNDQLQGSSGGEIWLVDPVGFQYQNVEKKLPQKGKSIITSIDIDIQMAAEEALGDKKGAVVAVEVKTGEILAMASGPSFDLNDLTPFIPQKVFDDINERSAWLNRATQGFYPPASPFKLVTALAGLRHEIIDRDEKFDCGSGFQVGDRLFREHDSREFGEVDLKRSIQVSSNVYFYPIALKMEADMLADEARRFGLNEKTNVELPYEGGRMLVPDPNWKRNKLGEAWRGGDTVNMSIGQGFLRVSPVQMAAFAAAFARKETRVKLTILHDRANDGRHPKSQPIGVEDADYDAIVEGMKLCVESGTAKHAQVYGMDSAAKTGTGQSRLDGKEVSTPCYFGFAPVEDPQVAVVVLIEGPDKSVWGGTTAGPVAQPVLQAYYDKYLSSKA